MRAKILVLSDSAAVGTRQDLTGPAVHEFLEARGWTVAALEVLPDDLERIAGRLREWSEDGGCDVVFTAGGTGLAPRDIAPEATRRIIDREIPGFSELMRAEGLKKTRRAVLSRGLAGLRKGTLIVNLPGSPRGARDSLEVIADLLPHAIEIAQGRTEHSDGR